MKFLIFLVLCIFGATICNSSPVDGPQTAIVNGINAPQGTAPFHAHIHLSKYSKKLIKINFY